MSRPTNVVIAIIVGVAIAGGFNSVGLSSGGIFDQLMLGLVPFIGLGFLIFGIYASLRTAPAGGGGGGGGGGGVSPADFAALTTAVNTGFTTVQTRIDAVKMDTAATRTAVDEVKTAVGRMEAMLTRWAPFLNDLNATINALLAPITKSVDDIKALTTELKTWTDTKWKKFSDDITVVVNNVFDKVKTVDVDMLALKGAVGKLDADQQTVLREIGAVKTEQATLLAEVQRQFGQVPASVAQEVQKGLNLLQGALSKEIGDVKLSQGRMEAVLTQFNSAFNQFQLSVSGQLGALPSSVAQSVRGEIDQAKQAIEAAKRDLLAELGRVGLAQGSMQNAVVLLTDAQTKLHARVEQAISGLPRDVQQLVEAQLQRVEGVFTQNIQQLKNEQTQLASSTKGLAGVVQGMQGVILARIDRQRQSTCDQLNRQLVQVREVIQTQIEPVVSEMFEINKRMAEVMQKMTEQGSAIKGLSDAERDRFEELRKRMAGVQLLLVNISNEGAKADELKQVHDGVGMIAQYLVQEGGRLDALIAQMPPLAPLLDEMRKLTEKLQERQKKARNAVTVAVKEQEGIVIYVSRRFKFTQWRYDEQAGTLFTGLMVLKTYLADKAKKADEKKRMALAILAAIKGQIDALCADKDSALWEMSRIEKRQRRVGEPLPKKLEDELELLTNLCPPSGRLSVGLDALGGLAGKPRSAITEIERLVEELLADSAFREVAKLDRARLEVQLKTALGID